MFRSCKERPPLSTKQERGRESKNGEKERSLLGFFPDREKELFFSVEREREREGRGKKEVELEGFFLCVFLRPLEV